jgi:hypothetical protein
MLRPLSRAAEYMIPEGGRDAIAAVGLAGTVMQRMPTLAPA